MHCIHKLDNEVGFAYQSRTLGFLKIFFRTESHINLSGLSVVTGCGKSPDRLILRCVKKYNHISICNTSGFLMKVKLFLFFFFLGLEEPSQ